jgi:hypothetical protein
VGLLGGLLERGRKLGALGLDLAERHLELRESPLRGAQRLVAVEQFARQLGGVGERLVERGANRGFFLLGERQLLLRRCGLGLELNQPLVEACDALGEAQIVVAGGLQVGSELRNEALQVEDLGAPRVELLGLLGRGALPLVSEAASATSAGSSRRPARSAANSRCNSP